MDRFSIQEFENDFEFEEYLATTNKWENWSLFDEWLITEPHKTIALCDGKLEELVGLAMLSYSKNEDLIYIRLFQVRDDLKRKGYGSQLLRKIEKEYAYKYSGFKLNYDEQSLGFWLNRGFEYTDDFEYLVK